MQLFVCPKCQAHMLFGSPIDHLREFNCTKCHINWRYKEVKQPKQKNYNVIHNDVGINNVFYASKLIETTHNFQTALGDTISEKNQSLYIRMIELSRQLGNQINYITCSIDWWNDYWQYTSWIKLEKQEAHAKGTLVGKIHDCIPVYTHLVVPELDFAIMHKFYWVIIGCPDGVCLIDIIG